MFSKRKVAIAAAVVAGAVSISSADAAISFTAYWYDVSTSATDFGSQGFGCCGTVVNNEVKSTLGPDGLPVLNPAFTGPAINFVDPTTKELQWWNPSNSSGWVTIDSPATSVIVTPTNRNMFPPSGTGNNDTDSFQTAILKENGSFKIGPGGGSIFFGGDDDVFLALSENGGPMTIVDQVGGIHPTSDTTWDLGAGTYTAEIFYADRYHVDANLQFSVAGAVPETSTWAMMGLGFIGLGYAGYHKSRKDRLASAIA